MIHKQNEPMITCSLSPELPILSYHGICARVCTEDHSFVLLNYEDTLWGLSSVSVPLGPFYLRSTPSLPYRRYTSYNDPVARFLLATHIGIPKRITDLPLIATYTYMGGYVGSEKSDLAPHTDRPQCEFTASVSLDISPTDAECPLGLNPVVMHPDNLKLTGIVHRETGPEDQQVYVYPRMGDALLFKGRHLVHWRKPIAPGVNCTNVFLHHVHDTFPEGLN